MVRKFLTFFVFGSWAMAAPAAAQETGGEPASSDKQSDEGGAKSAVADEATNDKPTSEDQPASQQRQAAEASAKPVPAPPTANEKPSEEPGEGWHTFVTGYFRAPMSMGFSPRQAPDNKTGPSRLQVSYGPNRLVDASYYSFAYTRIQEQDWAELFVHAKKKHVEAVIGWMGYWFQSVGFRNADATWAPGASYLTLDTDIDVGEMKPNIALTVGAWWPKFGTFDKYDTYTLGRFRQLGEQVKLTLPFNPDVTMILVHGFGTNRDGSMNYTVNPPIYGATTGMDLIHYENLELAFKKYVDLGLHFNTQWTRDPNLTQQENTTSGKSYDAASKAYLLTVGGELTLSAPYAGRLWLSPSYIKVRNGWALANGGVEVMHSLGAAGLSANYLGWNNNPQTSTGTGSLLNLGFLYENTLSSILDQPRGSLPELTLNVFGLMANASLDLPPGSQGLQGGITQNRIRQFKYGADLTYQPLSWLGLMVRYDEVNYDLDHSGYVFSSITPRLIFSSHFLSSESIYIQYSRYRYGDNMVLNGTWPWGTELVAGNSLIQHGPYSGTKPDMDVIKIQATASF